MRYKRELHIEGNRRAKERDEKVIVETLIIEELEGLLIGKTIDFLDLEEHKIKIKIDFTTKDLKELLLKLENEE